MAEVKINPRTYTVTLEEWEAEELLDLLRHHENIRMSGLIVALRETIKIAKGERKDFNHVPG